MARLHAGLDVADKNTAICVINAAGGVLFESSVATTPTAIANALRPHRRQLALVGQETGTKSAWLHKELLRKRLPMICLDARRAKAALGARRNKTDKTDARGIATLLASGLYAAAYVKTDEALRIRLLLTIRKTLQRKALDLQTSIRMAAKTFGVSIQKKRRKVVRIEGDRATDQLFFRLCDTTLNASKLLLGEVASLDKLVLRLARADPICKRFMSIPGVGPIAALTFRAAVDDPTRFKSSRDVGAYFGLTPRRFQSGETDFQGGISRWGDSSTRTALYSAARALLHNSKSKCALRSWALDLAARKGSKLAAVACGRKLAVIMHRMWITGEPFRAASA